MDILLEHVIKYLIWPILEKNLLSFLLQQKHIDIVLKPAEKFKQKAQMNEDLKKFVDGL